MGNKQSRTGPSPGNYIVSDRGTNLVWVYSVDRCLKPVSSIEGRRPGVCLPGQDLPLSLIGLAAIQGEAVGVVYALDLNADRTYQWRRIGELSGLRSFPDAPHLTVSDIEGIDS